MNDREDSLRELFHTLRAEDEARAPSYERVLARRSPARGRIGPLVGVAIALLLLGVWWQSSSPADRRPAAVARPAESLSHWRAPTDFLLRTPGQELLEEFPPFESSPPALPTLNSSAKGVSP
jgi:hypothetical protein